MLASEIVHECCYTVKNSFVCDPEQMQGFLIFDSCSKKHNLYIVYFDEISLPIPAHQLVNIIKPQPLEFARNAFPHQMLTETNYGF